MTPAMKAATNITRKDRRTPVPIAAKEAVLKRDKKFEQRMLNLSKKIA